MRGGFGTWMRRSLWALAALWVLPASAQVPAQVPVVQAPSETLVLREGWRYRAGDDPAWAQPGFDDGPWEALPPLDDAKARMPTGRGWYRLRVAHPPAGPLALALGRAHAAIEVFANGHRVGHRGSVDDGDPVHRRGLDCLLLAPTEGPLVLAIRADLDPGLALLFTDSGSALGRRVWLGPRSAVEPAVQAESGRREAELWRGSLPDFLFALAFLLMGLFHLQLYVRRQEARDFLWFGLCALAMALRAAAMTDWAMEHLGLPVLVFRASWLFLFLSAPPFMQFLWPMLGRPVPRWMRAYQWSYVLPCAACFLPVVQAAPLLRAVGPYWGLPISCFSPVVVLVEARRGNREAKILLAGMGLLVLGGLVELGFWLHLLPFFNTLNVGFLAFLGSMAISVSDRYARAHTETEALNRDLESKVQARTQELEEVQARLHKLSAGAGQALRDPRAWSTAMAAELGSALGGVQVSVWRLEGETLSPLSSGAGLPPDLGRADTEGLERSGETLVPGGELVLSLQGLGGERLGAVRVSGKLQWSPAERRLVETFARQLGGALDMQRMRAEVEAAAERRASRREALILTGAGLLQICPRCGRCYDHTSLSCADDGTLLASPRTFPYRVQNRYRLERLLGEGGMGQVFEAEDERLHRLVAIKAIKADHFLSADKRLRFEQEARALAQIHHPGVIAIFDSGELEDGTIFIVTEHLRGATLRSLLAKAGPGSPQQVGAMALQCARALAATHEMGLLHRDIKPDNIFAVSAGGAMTFKLLDFGLAKEMAVDGSLTQTGALMGTPLYMSPEQIRGHALDGRSDLYALAAVVYEALSGQRLVRAEALTDILVEVVQGQPTPLADLVPGLPAFAARAMDAALDKDRNNRPASLVEWAENLDLALRAMPVGGGWPTELGDLVAGERFSTSGSRPRLEAPPTIGVPRPE